MRYKAALFDLDGTLTDSGEGIIQTGICAAKEKGIAIPDRAQLLRMRGPALIWSFTTLFGTTEEEALELIRIYRRYYPTVGPAHTTVFPGIEEMLRTLKDAGMRLFVCTAKYDMQARMLCEAFHIDGYFEEIYGTGDPELHETKADIIRRILNERGISEKDAVMIGDKDVDMAAGKAAGVDTIGVRYGYAAQGELESQEPTFLTENPETLTQLLLKDPQKAKKGLFIVFEGQDGSGKSTQIRALSQYLEEKGREVLHTREPGGTKVAEKIREILLDPENKGMNATCEAYLYAAARAEHVQNVILPALEAGKIVLCDRFMLSSIAYQGYGRELGVETVRQINSAALSGLEPDCTFFLSIDPLAGLSRIHRREPDRIELEGAPFHERVRRGYIDTAREDPKIETVDTTRPKPEVTADIIARFEKRFSDIL